jgi:hypothetical protein
MINTELGEALQESIIGTFGACLDEVVQECGQAYILDAETATAGVLTESLRDEALSGTAESGAE